MINKILLIDTILQHHKLVHIHKYDGKVFNYLNRKTVDRTCKNLLKQNNETFLSFLGIFSKNHHNSSNNLYRNLVTVNIKFDDKMKSLAKYSLEIDENVLTYREKKSIYHEILHMASSYNDYENEVYYRGFFQHNENKKVTIGEGLNEGYTELLSNRDINNDNYTSYSEIEDNYIIAYPISQALAHQLEIIIGKSEMEKMYFDNDLRGLVERIIGYGKTEKETFQFLKQFDISTVITKTSPKIVTNQVMKAQNFLKDICVSYFPDRIVEFEKHELISVRELGLGSILSRTQVEEIIEIKNNDNRKNQSASR